MMTANFLQLSRVRDACAEFLMARLCPSNVLGVKTFADTLGKLKCKKIIMFASKGTRIYSSFLIA